MKADVALGEPPGELGDLVEAVDSLVDLGHPALGLGVRDRLHALG